MRKRERKTIKIVWNIPRSLIRFNLLLPTKQWYRCFTTVPGTLRMINKKREEDREKVTIIEAELYLIIQNDDVCLCARKIWIESGEGIESKEAKNKWIMEMNSGKINSEKDESDTGGELSWVMSLFKKNSVFVSGWGKWVSEKVAMRERNRRNFLNSETNLVNKHSRTSSNLIDRTVKWCKN